MDTEDTQDYDSIPHSKHLTWVDKIKAGFQQAGNQRDYLVNAAAKRKAEYDDAQRAKKTQQAGGY